MIQWEIRPVGAFEQMRTAWDAVNQSASGSALLQSRFVALLLRHFGDDRIRLAVGTEAGEPKVLGLVQPSGKGVWSTFQPDQAPLGMWVTRPGIDQRAAAKCLLKRLPARAMLLGILHQDPDIVPRPATAAGLRTLDYIRTAKIPLDVDFDTYWSQRGKNLRHNLKRQRNRLEREGIEPRLVTANRPGEMADAVAGYGRLESAGWKRSTGTAVSPDNAQGAFYREVLEAFGETGDGFAYCLHYNDRLVATDLCILGNGSLNWLKTTYDESQTTSSPAAQLRHAAFRQAFADPRMRVIEFYGPVMDWHTKWANDIRTIYHTNVYRWGWLAGLHERLRRGAQADDPDQPESPAHAT